MKQAPLQFRELLRRLRDSEGEPLTRLLLSFSAALAATGALFGLAWLIAIVFPQWTAIPRSPATQSGMVMTRWYGVRDSDLAIAISMAAWLWLFAAWWIWRPMVRSSPWLAATLLTIGLIGVPFFCLGWQERLRISGWMIVSDELVVGASSIGALLATIAVWVIAWRKKRRHQPRGGRVRFVGNMAASVGIGLAALALAIAIDAAMRIEEEFLVAAALFAGAAAIALLWSRPLYRSENREIPTIAGKLDVRCPTCGYTLIGLHDLRCPECGSTFDLDELIASQAFITQRMSRRESRADAERPQDRPNPNSR